MFDCIFSDAISKAIEMNSQRKSDGLSGDEPIIFSRLVQNKANTNATDALEASLFDEISAAVSDVGIFIMEAVM